MEYGFYSYALLASLLSLVVERAFTKNSKKKERDCLEIHCERSLKLCDSSSTKVNLFLLTQEGECPGLWYALVFELTSYLN